MGRTVMRICRDEIHIKAIASPSDYMTVKVDPGSVVAWPSLRTEKAPKGRSMVNNRELDTGVKIFFAERLNSRARSALLSGRRI